MMKWFRALRQRIGVVKQSRAGSDVKIVRGESYVEVRTGSLRTGSAIYERLKERHPRLLVTFRIDYSECPNHEHPFVVIRVPRREEDSSRFIVAEFKRRLKEAGAFEARG